MDGRSANFSQRLADWTGNPEGYIGLFILSCDHNPVLEFHGLSPHTQSLETSWQLERLQLFLILWAHGVERLVGIDHRGNLPLPTSASGKNTPEDLGGAYACSHCTDGIAIHADYGVEPTGKRIDSRNAGSLAGFILCSVFGSPRYYSPKPQKNSDGLIKAKARSRLVVLL